MFSQRTLTRIFHPFLPDKNHIGYLVDHTDWYIPLVMTSITIILVTISNVTLLILWATLATMLSAHDWVDPVFRSRAVCISGVFIGGMVWYTLVATFVSRAHRVLSIRQLTVLQRICGSIFLGFAATLLYRICAR